MPIGAPEPMECPACGLMRGYRVALVLPAEGRVQFICDCGCEAFAIVKPTTKGKRRAGREDKDEGWIICINCGEAQAVVAVWA